MNSNLRYLGEELWTSYWFIPAVQGISAIALSVVTVEINHALSQHESWQVS